MKRSLPLFLLVLLLLPTVLWWMSRARLDAPERRIASPAAYPVRGAPDAPVT